MFRRMGRRPGLKLAVKVASQVRGKATAAAFDGSLVPRGYGWELPAFGISLKRDARHIPVRVSATTSRRPVEGARRSWNSEP